jgi:hypothetical protein
VIPSFPALSEVGVRRGRAAASEDAFTSEDPRGRIGGLQGIDMLRLAAVASAEARVLEVRAMGNCCHYPVPDAGGGRTHLASRHTSRAPRASHTPVKVGAITITPYFTTGVNQVEDGETGMVKALQKAKKVRIAAMLVGDPDIRNRCSVQEQGHQRRPQSG